jgi:hypothetical protein
MTDAAIDEFDKAAAIDPKDPSLQNATKNTLAEKTPQPVSPAQTPGAAPPTPPQSP